MLLSIQSIPSMLSFRRIHLNAGDLPPLEWPGMELIMGDSRPVWLWETTIKDIVSPVAAGLNITLTLWPSEVVSKLSPCPLDRATVFQGIAASRKIKCCNRSQENERYQKPVPSTSLSRS